MYSGAFLTSTQQRGNRINTMLQVLPRFLIRGSLMKIEEKVKSFAGRLPTSVYFCKGLAQEMSLVRAGEVIIKKRGLQLDKFLKKIAKSNIPE